MANDWALPYTGPASIDLSSMLGFLYDLGNGGTRGLKREGEDLHGVETELAASMSTYGADVGIAQAVYDRFLLTTTRIQQIRAARQVVDKMAEVLAESEAKLEDEREADIGIIVAAVRTAARRKDSSLLAFFEKTIQYHGQAALRGVKTRRKNAEAAAEAEAEASQGG